MKKVIKYLAGMTLVFAMSCGDDNPLDAGWSKFGERDYAGAHAEFSSLVSSEGSNAYVGLGWTTLMMDSLPEADAYFALAAEDSILEGYAGWSIVAWLLGQHNPCIDRAEFVFRNAGGYDSYEFPYDPEITHHDLLIHEGFSYYYLQNSFQCLNTIQKLDPSFTVALNNPNLQNVLLAKLGDLSQEYN
jgi:hypothetical protein